MTADALLKLLNHEVCAVHVRRFFSPELCHSVETALEERGGFSPWDINRKDGKGVRTEVEKVGVVSDEALGSLASFERYLESAADLEALLPGDGSHVRCPAHVSRPYFRVRYCDCHARMICRNSPTTHIAPLALTRALSVHASLPLVTRTPAHCDPGELNVFTQLRDELSRVHPQGCRINQITKDLPMPAGTFRRMRRSEGLIHADTGSLLQRGAGEFSANLYLRTPQGKGALNIFPTQQYSLAELPTLYALGKVQQAAFRSDAQATSDLPRYRSRPPPSFASCNPMLASSACDPPPRTHTCTCTQRCTLIQNVARQETLRAALPLKRTVTVEDGDVVLINTGRFHQVEPYDDGYRLSGQCWLSYSEGYPLLMWV